MSEVTKVRFGQTLILGECCAVEETKICILRPVIVRAVDKNQIRIDKMYVDHEDEKMYLHHIPGPVFVQQLSTSDELYEKYKELTSQIHLAKSMPPERRN